jgi:hypothetical protein
LAVRQYALCVLIVLLFTAFNVFVGLGRAGSTMPAVVGGG